MDLIEMVRLAEFVRLGVDRLADENAALRARVKQLEDAVEWACRHLDRLDNPEFEDKLSDELRRRAGRE